MNTQPARQTIKTENIISCSIIHYNDPHSNNLQAGNKISTQNEFPLQPSGGGCVDKDKAGIGLYGAIISIIG